MTPYYELWDLDSGNLVGHYDTEDDALRIVRESLVRYGAAGVEGLALSEDTVDGGGRLIAEGKELARLAKAPGVAHRGKPRQPP